jgi:prepilin-type N-terminal cleavage/methylation domain-containing protein
MREAGLTLLEVLVALVLLSLVAATTLPLVRDTSRALRETSAVVGTFKFEETVDEFTADPVAFGAEGVQGRTTDRGEFAAQELGGEVVRYHTIPSPQSEQGAGWRVFEWQDLQTLRWIPPEPGDEVAVEMEQ